MELDKYLQHYTMQRERVLPLIDRVKRAKKTFQETFTDFLSPEEQSILKSICFGEGLEVKFFGSKGDYERAMGAISDFEYFGDFPVKIVKINGNLKFEKLNHRDYLGAILSLGVKREKIGDINVYEDGAEIWVHSDIADYILFNLEKIKHTGVKTSFIDYDHAREKIQLYRDKTDNVASLRLDSIVASALNLSRAKAADIIKGGDVKLNYFPASECSIKVNQNDILSIKGHGRYKIDSILGTTKKDRITVLIKQYL